MLYHSDLLTKQEVAERLRIEPRTVDAWRLEGRIRAVYLGSKVIRYKRKEVERFIEESEGGPDA
tara:strand:- start:215 stop:406 length:192 start_codon:yes stop_codon:yes gene_type:complete